MWKLQIRRVIVIVILSLISYLTVSLLTKPNRDIFDIALAIWVVAGQVILKENYKKLWCGKKLW